MFSLLGEERYALGIETIYEGYLLHYGTPRLFAPQDGDAALLLGDYLYAHGLVRIEEVGTVEAVSDLAELIALCAYLRAEGIAGDGPVWAATAVSLGRGELDEGRSRSGSTTIPGRSSGLPARGPGTPRSIAPSQPIAAGCDKVARDARAAAAARRRGRRDRGQEGHHRHAHRRSDLRRA